MPGVRETEILIPADGVTLPGILSTPPRAIGIVIFVHGSGSSRLSPRNRQVANVLVESGCATLLFDLLTEPEAADRSNVFDIALLARRVRSATQWLYESQNCPIGYFGASTGAAAALVASVDSPIPIASIVSRGGRPDLAGDFLPRVAAPTFLIVGSLDEQVLELNRKAQSRMRCESKLSIIKGATHLFEEPQTLEHVCAQASDWFRSTLGGGK